jgi:cobalt-zinc-cadmium efflux system outer membrane protein
MARERQATAYANPVLSYQREQTFGAGQTNSQNIASIDQPVELGAVRAARRGAARLRREVAVSHLAAAESQIEFEVTRAYALALAADRRALLAQQAVEAFTRAQNASQARLVAGDISGYANRRIRLETARYAGLLAEAMLTRRAAHLALAELVAPSPDAIANREFVLEEPDVVSPSLPTADSLQAMAVLHRAELRIATLEAEIAAADTRLIMKERLPVPTLSAGFRNEKVTGGASFNGFVAGISLPLQLWDRRLGAIEASRAGEALRAADVDVVRRRIAREIADAVASFRAVDEQIALLQPQLGAESATALRAAQVAYDEGEISLAEWLDSVRAYQEAEARYAMLRAESLIRRAALERAIGAPLSGV